MPFVLDSDDLFIGSYTSGLIRVLRIDKSQLQDSLLAPSTISSAFSTVRDINTNSSDEDLEVFNTVIYGKKLRDLASDLCKPNSWPTTNRQGFMYIYSSNCFYRVNDLFGWSKYGVVPPLRNIWNRYDLHKKEIAINLVEKEESLKDCKSQLEKLAEELCLCKWNLEEKENKCSNLEKRLEESENMLHNLEKLLKEKEKGSSYLEKNLEEKKKECSELEKSSAKKDRKLQECRSQLKSKETEVSFMVRMMEKRHDHHAKDKLSPLDHQKHLQEHYKETKEKISLLEKNLEVIVSSKPGLEDKDKELMICKLLLEEKEGDLKKICDQLLAERKQVSALRVGMRCLVSYVKELHEGLHREVDYNFPLLTMSYEEDHVFYPPAMASDGRGSSALAQLSERLLHITEHPHNENINDEEE